MSNFIKFCKDFLKDEEGLTVVEYVVGAAFLVTAISLVFTNLGNALDDKLDNVVGNIDSTGTPG